MTMPEPSSVMTAPALPPEPLATLPPARSPTDLAIRRGLGHGGFMTGATILAVLVFAALAAPLIAPHDPYAQDVSRRLIPPIWQAKGNWDHLLGTDKLGRDYLAA